MTGKEKIYWKLHEARQLIEKGWCQVDSAQTADGTHSYYKSGDAVKFCMLGAHANVSYFSVGNSSLFGPMNEVISRFVPKGDMSGYNDAEGRTQAEILAVYDKALAYLKKEIVDAIRTP